MAGSDVPFRIADCRGGQNSAESPLALAPNQVASALNVEWYRASVARKRRGSRLCERDSGSALPSDQVFTTLIGSQYASHSAYQVLIQGTTNGFFSWGTNSTPPLTDWQAATGGPSGFAVPAAVVRFNGKWFMAVNTADDRMYQSFRGSSPYSAHAFVGLAAPSGNPTITPSAGAITNARRYRYCLIRNETDGQTRSEPSPETSIGLVAQRATATAPGTGAGNDLYDSWELQVASDDDNYATWWVVGQDLGTNNLVDNNASILGLEPAPQEGLFIPPRSHKYLGVDDSRLLMAGLYEDSTNEALQQRVWFTPVLGDRDEGDDERVPDLPDLDSFVDLDGGDAGGPITAIGPNILGGPLVFKTNQTWRLSRTGALEAPYLPRMVDPTTGTFGYRTVCAGQDARGGACVYFAGSRGVFRLGDGRAEYISEAIENLWSTVNLHGDIHTSQHAVYYTDRGQYWLWVSTAGSTVPNVLLIYTVASGGWASYTGPIATAKCSAMLPRYISEENRGITTANVLTAPLVPYCCPNTAGQLVECDAINPNTGAALDTDLETWTSGNTWADGTAYAASITTGAIQPKELDGWVSVSGGTIAADSSTSVPMSITLIPDFDTTRQRVATTDLTPSGSSTVAVKTVDGCQIADCRHVQAKIGDATAMASQWVVRAVQLRVKGAADR